MKTYLIEGLLYHKAGKATFNITSTGTSQDAAISYVKPHFEKLKFNDVQIEVTSVEDLSLEPRIMHFKTL